MWTQRVRTQCLTSWERNWPWQAVISIWCPYYIIFSSSLVSFLLTSFTLVQFFKGFVWIIRLNDGWGGFICQLTKLNFSSWKYDCCLLGFFILWKKTIINLEVNVCERYMNYLPLVGNDSHISGMWNLADRLIQQVALQQKNGQDPDSAPVEMNVKQMIRQ